MTIMETKAECKKRKQMLRARIARKMITCLRNLEGARFNDEMTSPPAYMRLHKLANEYEEVQ